jgi:hypothetical protein
MSVFKTEKFVPVVAKDLPSVGREIARHFQQQGYTSEVEPSVIEATVVNLHKPGIFRAVLGMNTSLNINLEPVKGGTMVRAEIGLDSAQTIPTAIMILARTPFVVTQIWGCVQQLKLDEEAVRISEETLHKMAGSDLAESSTSRTENKKSTFKVITEDIKNVSLAAGALAVGAGAIKMASVAEELTTSIDSLASVQSDLASNLSDLAKAEVVSSVISATGEIVGSFVKLFGSPSGLLERLSPHLEEQVA